MSGDRLDLDDLLRLAEGGFTLKDSEVARIAAEVRRLRAKVAEVGRIHAPYDAGCGWDACSLDGETYPCATVVALDGP